MVFGSIRTDISLQCLGSVLTIKTPASFVAFTENLPISFFLPCPPAPLLPYSSLGDSSGRLRNSVATVASGGDSMKFGWVNSD